MTRRAPFSMSALPSTEAIPTLPAPCMLTITGVNATAKATTRDPSSSVNMPTLWVTQWADLKNTGTWCARSLSIRVDTSGTS